jgi:tetratricopeptide (TPR) repeat protein
MKSIHSLMKAVFVLPAVLAIAVPPAWSGQPAEGAGTLRQAQEFYSTGKKYMQNGNFTAANDAFEKAELVLGATGALPPLPEAPDMSPQLLPQAPRSPARGAVSVDTLDPNIYYNLGVGALQKGDFIQAEAAFLRVVDMSPLDKEACYNLGVLYEKYFNRPKDALIYYKRYINLSDENDRDVERVKGWMKVINERARE